MAEEIPTITREQYNQILAGSAPASQQEAEIPTISRAQYNELIGGQPQGPKFDFGPNPKVSDVGGMMNQAGQGMLAGFGDEIGAGLDTGYNFLTGQGGGASIGEQYDAALGARRGAESDFKKQSPWLAGGAELAGAIGSPINLMMPGGGGIKGAATTGARLGALSGIGNSEGGAENRLMGGVKGGAISGAVGGGIAAIGAGARGVGSWMKGSGDKLKAAGTGATKTDFKMSQRYGGLIPDGEGGKTTKLMSSIQSVIDDGTFKGVSKNSTEDMIFANSDRIAKYEKELTSTLNAADKLAAERGISIQPDFKNAERFAYKANPLERDAIIQEFENGKVAISKLLDGTLNTMQEVKKDLYRATYTDTGAVKGELAAKMAQDLKESIERGAIIATGKSDLSRGVKAINANTGKHIEVEKLLARRFAQEQGSDPVKNIMGGLRTSGGNLTTPTMIGKATGGEGGGKLGFLAGVALNLLNTPGGKMIAGQGLKKASPWLASAGNAIGKTAPTAAMLSGKLGSQQGAPSMDNPEVKQPVAQLEQPSPVTPKGEIDPALIDAIIQTESAGNPKAVSPTGAKGLMQLMPAMAKAFGVTDPFDPEENVRGGTELLKEELKRFGGDVRLALAAYNAGSPAVMRAINRAESADFEVIKQYLPKETQNYVPKVMKIYGV